MDGNFSFIEKSLRKNDKIQYSFLPWPPEKIHVNNITISNRTFPTFSWKIGLRRMLTPYILETFCPMGIFVAVSWISFTIQPSNVPGRCGMLVVLLLTLTTFHLREMDKSPVAKDINPILIWSIVCLMMVAIALFEYAFILYFTRFGFTNDLVLKLMKSDLEKINDLENFEKNGGSKLGSRENISEGPVDVLIKNKYTKEKRIEIANPNDEIIRKIDYYSLIIIPIIFAIFLLIYWIYYIYNYV